MANFGLLVLTSLGIQEQYKAQAGQSLKFKRIAMGSGKYSGNIASLTKLVSENVSVDISKGYMQNEMYVVEGFFSNEGLQTGFEWREVGLFLEDQNGKEILYCYANAGDTYDYIPATVDERYSKYVRIATAIGNATNVTIVENQGILHVDYATFNAAVEELRTDVDSLWATKKASGASIITKDSAELPFAGLNIHGKSTQIKTNGYQLFNHNATELTKISKGGATVTNHGDGRFTVSGSGTLTESVSYYHYYTHAESVKLFKAGRLYLKHTGTITTPKIYIHPQVNSTSLTTLTAGNNTQFELTQDMIDDETFRMVIGVYGNKGETIVAGTFSIMLYQDGDGTLELFTDGTVAPSPDCPQEIENIGDSGSVEMSTLGKNLFDKSKATLKVRVSGENGTFSDATFENCGCSDYIMIRGFADIFISGDVVQTETDHRIAFFTQDKKFISGIRGNNPNIVLQNCSYKVPTNAFYVVFNFAIKAIDDIQLEVGTTVTPYEAYKPMQNFSVAITNGLAGIPVKSGGNYTDENGRQWICDEVDFARGVHIQRIGKVTIDSNYTWHSENHSTYTAWWTALNTAKRYTPGNGIVLCTRYKDNGEPYSGLSNMNCALFNPYDMSMREGENRLYIRNDSFSTADDVNAYFAESTMDVYFALTEPIETILTESEIEAYNALNTYNPNTTIINDAGAEMSVEYITASHEGSIGTVIKRQGDLKDLKTESKTSLVMAINEIASTRPRFAYGTYTGTGAYGEATPNKLTFDFEPKIVLIAEQDSRNLSIFTQGMNQFTYTYQNTVPVDLIWNGNSVSYYATESAEVQRNKTGVVYHYFALG